MAVLHGCLWTAPSRRLRFPSPVPAIIGHNLTSKRQDGLRDRTEFKVGGKKHEKLDRGDLPYNVWCISISKCTDESRRDFPTPSCRISLPIFLSSLLHL